MATARVAELEKRDREAARVLQQEVQESGAAKNRLLQLEPLAAELAALRPQLAAASADLGRVQARATELEQRLRQADGARQGLASELELLQPLVPEVEQLRADVATLAGKLQAANAQAAEVGAVAGGWKGSAAQRCGRRAAAAAAPAAAGALS
jgi:chromosome segregation ATPase